MFRMPDQVQLWFKDIFKKESSSLKYVWDLYYLCLLMGLSDGNRLPMQNPKEMVDYFIEEYKRSQRLIISLMVTAELNGLAIKFTEKELVKKQLENYLTADNQSNLTNAGFEAMNEYAWSGFQILCQHMAAPKHFPTFIIEYQKILIKTINKNKFWSSP